MSGAPDFAGSGMLHVQVAEDCTLDGGTWHLTTDRHGAPTVQISPPGSPYVPAGRGRRIVLGLGPPPGCHHGEQSPQLSSQSRQK